MSFASDMLWCDDMKKQPIVLIFVLFIAFITFGSRVVSAEAQSPGEGPQENRIL